MIVTNRFGMSECWMHAYRNLQYDQLGWRSVTTLIAPPRSKILQERHDADITVDITDLMWLIVGSGAHEILARTSVAGIINEQRFILNHKGREISMKPDWLERLSPEYVAKHHHAMIGKVCYRLDDFKFTTVWAAQKALSEGGRIEYEAQLNLYRFGLMKQCGFNVVELGIQAALRDWNYSDCHVKKLYNLPPAVSIPIPLWTPEKAEAYLDERIAIYDAAEKLPDADLPVCTEQERWATPSVWAVKKMGSKSALPGAKAFSTKEEAEAFRRKRKDASECEVQFRPGNSPRCNPRFCYAAPFCNVRHRFIPRSADDTEG